MAIKGTLEVRAAKRFHGSPKAFFCFRSIEKGPPTARIRKLPKKITEARSPLSTRGVKDQRATPQRKGCRVIRWIPFAGSFSVSRAPPPTEVGFGVVNARTTKKKATSITIKATGRSA